MEAELSTVAVVGQAEVGGGGRPEGAGAVSVPLVLLEQLEVLEEEDPLTHHGDSNLLQVGLLNTHTHTHTSMGAVKNDT